MAEFIERLEDKLPTAQEALIVLRDTIRTIGQHVADKRPEESEIP